MWYDPQPCKIKALLLLADWLKLVVQPGEAFVGKTAGNEAHLPFTPNREQTVASILFLRNSAMISNHDNVAPGKLSHFLEVYIHIYLYLSCQICAKINFFFHTCQWHVIWQKPNNISYWQTAFQTAFCIYFFIIHYLKIIYLSLEAQAHEYLWDEVPISQ